MQICTYLGPLKLNLVNEGHQDFAEFHIKSLTCGDRVNSVKLGQYHGFWCPGSLRRQDISSHDIDYVE